MTIRKNFFAAFSIFALLFLVLASGCKKDDEVEDKPMRQVSYDMKVKDVLGVSGKVTFIERANSTTIEIELNGVSDGNHPAHIHFNSAVETGGIAVTLSSVDGNGESTTSVTHLDDNTPITYDELIAFNGYINVHQSASNLGVIVSQGDIGGNALTGASKTYNLTEKDSSGVSGTALFEKRNNNNTLVTITLDGTLAGGSHPTQIHLGDVNTVGGGPVVAELNDVNGDSGKGFTNVTKLSNGTLITYDNWMEYDGYLNIIESSANPNYILCQGNIGAL
ncbi:MAG: CHRD domain-containing protein [Chitinophagales bacterium]